MLAGVIPSRLDDSCPYTHGLALTVGARLGPYEILSALGAGGMGEVYRARDTTLGRHVAIKILPRAYSADPGRRARFDREARLLAALNHGHFGSKMHRSRDGGATWSEIGTPTYPEKPAGYVPKVPVEGTPADWSLKLIWALAPGGTDEPGVVWCGEAAGANPYEGLLAWADRIVCSPASVNMVSEACATEAPVFVFDPVRVSGRPRRFLDSLLAHGRIRAMDTQLAPFKVEPLRETARVAALVRERLSL